VVRAFFVLCGLSFELRISITVNKTFNLHPLNTFLFIVFSKIEIFVYEQLANSTPFCYTVSDRLASCAGMYKMFEKAGVPAGRH